MQFHDWASIYESTRRARLRGADRLAAMDWYESVLPLPQCEHWIIQAQLRAEHDWYLETRPYYSVWPVAVGSLTRLRLDIDSDLVHLPLPTLLVRFAVGHELDALGDGSRLIRAILAARSRVTGGERGIILFCDYGERKSLPNSDQPFAVHSFRSFLLRPGLSIEDSLKRVDHVEVAPEAREPEEAFDLAIRLVCTLGLLGGDPDIVQPDVLERDRRRYDETQDPAIVDRAVLL